jgi:hypothetical protein
LRRTFTLEARALYAHAEAYAHLVRALALGYPQLPGRIALGEVLVVLGRYREALAEFETAAALAGAGEGVAAADDAEAGEEGGDGDRGSAGDRAVHASIEHKLADVHHRLGDWDLAEVHLAVVTEMVADVEPGRLARAEADRAVVAYRRGDAERGRLRAGRALLRPGRR